MISTQGGGEMMGVSLRAARVNAGYTQSEAAKELRISVYTLGNYEKGKTYPDYPLIRRMLELYGLSFDEINFSPKLPLNGNLC